MSFLSAREHGAKPGSGGVASAQQEDPISSSGSDSGKDNHSSGQQQQQHVVGRSTTHSTGTCAAATRAAAAAGSSAAAASSRPEIGPTATDRRWALFYPWFVERAFQSHYHANTLIPIDRSAVPILIWCSCMLVTYSSPWELLTTLLPLLLELWVLSLFLRQSPEQYAKRRTKLVVLRRLSRIPYLAFVQFRRPLQAPNSWQAAGMQLLVASGGASMLAANFLWLAPWWVAAAETAASTVLMWTAARASCSHALAGPFPLAGWRAAASLMDRATLGIYRASVSQPEMAHAVCCTTLNTTLVMLSCVAVYLVSEFERRQRLRYKAQLPPAVAAMQTHMFGIPVGLNIAQAVLLVVFPSLVLSWVVLGAWYGLHRGPVV